MGRTGVNGVFNYSKYFLKKLKKSKNFSKNFEKIFIKISKNFQSLENFLCKSLYKVLSFP